MEMQTINGYCNIINQHNRVGANIIRPRDLYHSTGTRSANHVPSAGETNPSVSAYAEPAPLQGAPNRFRYKAQFAVLILIRFRTSNFGNLRRLLTNALYWITILQK